MKITIKDKTAGTARILRNVDFATSMTLNQIAYKAKDHYVPKYINDNLDIKRKTVATSSAKVVLSKKDNLQASVFISQDWHMSVLEQHFEGGDRERMMFEKELMFMDDLSPSGISIKSNRLKTLTKRRYATIKDSLGKKGSKYFVLSKKRKDIPQGVYERFAKGIKPVTIFAGSPDYNKFMNLYDPVFDAVTENFERYFKINMLDAIRR